MAMMAPLAGCSMPSIKTKADAMISVINAQTGRSVWLMSERRRRRRERIRGCLRRRARYPKHAMSFDLRPALQAVLREEEG